MVNYFRVTVSCSLFYFYDIPTRALDTVSVIMLYLIDQFVYHGEESNIFDSYTEVLM